MQKKLAAAMIGLLLASSGTALHADDGPPPAVALPPIQIVPDTPRFEAQTLALADFPRPSGKAARLFNGRDLSGFTPWLGKAGGGMLFPGSPEKPMGSAGIGEVFRVVQVDGGPAIYVSGRT
jgi:hypothetical protein